MGVKVENRWHFAVPIMEAEIPDFAAHQAALVRTCLALRETAPGIRRSNQGGWHSESDLFRTTDPELRWLIEQVGLIGTQLVRHHEGDGAFRGRVVMTDFWININDAGSWNAPHSHLPCEWSGAVYLSVDAALAQRPAGSTDGDILFFDPMPTGPEYGRNPTVNYTPRDGTMFLFPGWLLHMVAPHMATVPRITCAFNFRVVPPGVEARG